MRSMSLFAANRAAIQRAGLPDPGAAAPLPSAGPAGPAAPARLPATVYVPPRLPAGAAPLVCMLHGCTQDAASFAAATRMNAAADRHGFVVVYPEQPRQANQRGCWNWFEPGHQARGRGEPAAIVAVVQGVVEARAIDAERVFVAGLSAGGAMAAVLAAAYPDVFAAVAVHSGLASGAARGVGEAFAAMAKGAREHAAVPPAARPARPVPTFVIHGSADETVVPRNGEQVLRQSMAAGDFDPAHPTHTDRGRAAGGLDYVRAQWCTPDGALVYEALTVDGLGHAWSGGAPGGSFTDPRGPDATAAIWRFFGGVRPL